ncbi:response regulator [Cohnella sp. 56]|uniref:response regulator n=1 Tax=Cohnella sp. 56 TaxID=3113722 RepID=UPI0030E9AD9D
MSLIKLMIVEDEWLVREGLKSTIPWDELGCEIVAEASSGAAALDIVESARPDIILTDIRMPGMDGLEMARQAVERLPGVEIVFLTGFDDFSYAQQALKIGSADYVLKPTNPDELMQVIRRVGDKVRRRKTTEQTERFIRQTRFRDSGSLLSSKLLYDLLMDSAGEKEKELFLELGADRAASLAAYRVGLIEPDGPELAAEDARRQLVTLEEMLYRTTVAFTRAQDRIAVLLGERDSAELWPDLLDELRAGLGGRPIAVGWSETHRELGELAEAYEEAELALTAQRGTAQGKASRPREMPSVDKLKAELRETIAYIEEHYREDISLHDIASSVHMSESGFSRLFKKQTGVSYVEFVTQLRLEEAKTLLLQPDQKVYEVSLTVGYQDSKYFSQIFRKYTGETPTEFRKRQGLF